MFFRVFCFIIFLALVSSCDKLPFSKKQNTQVLDTIVNFSEVDISPSFKNCDSIINKEFKSNCFRNTIHKKIGEELQRYSLQTKDSINETVFVKIKINNTGFFEVDTIQSSKNIQQKLPELDSLLKNSIQKLPKIFPALKRGIPVTTLYQLPIKIQLKE